MKFFLATITFCVSLFAQATMVDGISFFVNESPVTLYQLFKTKKEYGVGQDEAVEILINKKLEDEEIERLGIKVDDEEIRKKISEIASRNSLTYGELKNRLESQGGSWKLYQDEIKRALRVEALSQKLARESMKMPTESEIKNYYEMKKDRFMMPTIIDTIQYSSDDKKAIQNKIANPLSSNEGLQVTETTIDLKQLPPEFASLFITAQEGGFTQIVTLKDDFVTFFVKEKKGAIELPFEAVKTTVLKEMMMDGEKRSMESHFEKLRAQAKIRVVRLP